MMSQVSVSKIDMIHILRVYMSS